MHCIYNMHVICLLLIEFCEMNLWNLLCNINMFDPVMIWLVYLLSKLMLIPLNFLFQMRTRSRMVGRLVSIRLCLYSWFLQNCSLYSFCTLVMYIYWKFSVKYYMSDFSMFGTFVSLFKGLCNGWVVLISSIDGFVSSREGMLVLHFKL